MPISDGYRVLAILVGSTLLAIVALLRLLETTGWRGLALAVAVVGAVAGGLWLAQPLLIAIGNGSLVLFFVVLVAACVIIGVPIAFTFGIATFSYLALTTSLPLVDRRQPHRRRHLEPVAARGADVRLSRPADGDDRDRAGHGQFPRGIDRPRQGRPVSYVLLGAMYLVSGISGSKAADMAAVAPILFPEMRKRGAHPGELASMLATSSAMSETIPPSLVLITIGSVTEHLDRRLVHRRSVAGRGGGAGAGRRRLVPLAPRRYRRRQARRRCAR